MASLNDPSAPLSAVRTPRCALLANSSKVGGLVSLQIVSTNNYHCDTFRAELSVNAPGAQPASFWFNTDTITIELQAGVRPDLLVSQFIGEVDHVHLDMLSGAITLDGRDLSRRLIDAKTAETFQNQTSSQVATTLALRHGLTPAVTATTTLVSRFYSEDHDHTTQDSSSRTQTEWDLLVYLAQQEGFDLFVQGFELHFQPKTPDTAPPYVVGLDLSGAYPQSNAVSISAERSLTLASDIEVWVKSWNADKKYGFIAKSRGKMNSKRAGPPQRVVVVRPNLTHEQAQALANSVRADLTRKERLLDITLPGDSVPTPRDRLRLEGSGTSCDQLYYIDTITRQLDVQSGYAMQLACKNHSPLNESIPV